MRRLPDGRISEIFQLLCTLPERAGLANSFFPIHAGRVLPGAIAAALAERAGPTSDYTSPPQEPHVGRELMNQLIDNATLAGRTRPTREPLSSFGGPEHDMGPSGARLRPGS